MLFGAHQFCYRQHPWYVMMAVLDDSSCLRCFAETWSEDLYNTLGWKPLIVQLRLWIFPVNDFFEVEAWKITLAGYLFTCVPDKPWHWTVHVQTMGWFTLHPPTMPVPQVTLFLCHISIPWTVSLRRQIWGMLPISLFDCFVSWPFLFCKVPLWVEGVLCDAWCWFKTAVVSSLFSVVYPGNMLTQENST